MWGIAFEAKQSGTHLSQAIQQPCPLAVKPVIHKNEIGITRTKHMAEKRGLVGFLGDRKTRSPNLLVLLFFEVLY
jgi:hypothetical protein